MTWRGRSSAVAGYSSGFTGATIFTAEKAASYVYPYPYTRIDLSKPACFTTSWTVLGSRKQTFSPGATGSEFFRW